MIHVLIDANVPLNMYLAHAQQRPLINESVLVMDAIAKGSLKGYITPTIFSNVHYFLRKYLGPARAVKHSEDLLSHTSMIPQDEKTFREALRSGWPDVEDAAQYFALRSEKLLTHLCSMNIKHYKKATGIKVVDPAMLLRLI
jgi:hypothetical protein